MRVSFALTLAATLLLGAARGDEAKAEAAPRKGKGGDFGTVWGRQAKKICDKAAEGGTATQIEACTLLEADIKESFNMMAK